MITKRAPSTLLTVDIETAKILGLAAGLNTAEAVMEAAKAKGYRARVGSFSAADGILTIDLVKET